MKTLVVALAMLLNYGIISSQHYDWSGVEEIFGKKGSIQDDVLKITFPRSDLKVSVGDFYVAPGLALTSWISFINTGNDPMKMADNTMIMGDIVLLDKEIAPVISRLMSSGLEVTALHNHLAGESPSVKYVHFSGKGEATRLAEQIKSVISVTGTPLTTPQAQNQTIQPYWTKVEAILGVGKHNANLLQYSFPRAELLTESGMVMPPSMGMATAINFQLAGDKAAITGDYVLLADEVNPVVKALTENNIAVTAIHNHMLHDNPRLFMLHFWAVDDPEKLAAGIKAALDKTNAKITR